MPTAAKLTAAQSRVLNYIADCRRAPPKCRRSTLLALAEAGLIAGFMHWDHRVTDKGREVLASL